MDTEQKLVEMDDMHDEVSFSWSCKILSRVEHPTADVLYLCYGLSLTRFFPASHCHWCKVLF